MKTTTPDPFQTALEQIQWPWWGTPLIVLVVILILGGGIAYMVLVKGGNPVDRMQPHLRKNNNLAPVLYPARLKATRKKLHPDVPDLPVGQRIGTVVGSGQTWVLQGWRDAAVYICGTGRGKTSALVVRHMLEAPGAAVMTTNKVDGVQEVLAGRQHAGAQWVYDPTRVYRHDTRPDFVYNPLDDVQSLTDAQELAAIFEASTKDADSKKDAQFDSQGLDLFAYALLGARLEGKSLRQVFEWIVNHQHAQIAEVMARHGQIGPKMALEGMKNQPDKTRGSVYATAQRMASAIANDDLLAWAMTTGVRKFNPEAFVRSNDTAVLISRNGPGSGGAFVASLVRAIAKAGERAAAANGGRVKVPVVFELDEAANVVRWPELPELVSYYGSMGLSLGVYFQGWSQMVRVFGQAGAEQLWTTAPIRVYGGGEDPLSPFLERFSKGIGNYEEYTTTRSHGPSGSTTSRPSKTKPILPVDVLASLPEWRAVLSSTAVKPVLIRTRPWFEDKVLTAMVNGQEVRNGKIVKQEVKQEASTSTPATPTEGGARVEPV